MPFRRQGLVFNYKAGSQSLQPGFGLKIKDKLKKFDKLKSNLIVNSIGLYESSDLIMK